MLLLHCRRVNNLSIIRTWCQCHLAPRKPIISCISGFILRQSIHPWWIRCTVLIQTSFPRRPGVFPLRRAGYATECLRAVNHFVALTYARARLRVRPSVCVCHTLVPTQTNGIGITRLLTSGSAGTLVFDTNFIPYVPGNPPLRSRASNETWVGKNGEKTHNLINKLLCLWNSRR